MTRWIWYILYWPALCQDNKRSNYKEWMMPWAARQHPSWDPFRFGQKGMVVHGRVVLHWLSFFDDSPFHIYQIHPGYQQKTQHASSTLGWIQLWDMRGNMFLGGQAIISCSSCQNVFMIVVGLLCREQRIPYCCSFPSMMGWDGCQLFQSNNAFCHTNTAFGSVGSRARIGFRYNNTIYMYLSKCGCVLSGM